MAVAQTVVLTTSDGKSLTLNVTDIYYLRSVDQFTGDFYLLYQSACSVYTKNGAYSLGGRLIDNYNAIVAALSPPPTGGAFLVLNDGTAVLWLSIIPCAGVQYVAGGQYVVTMPPPAGGQLFVTQESGDVSDWIDQVFVDLTAGGSGTPYDGTPEPVQITGGAGSGGSSEFARGDHAHAFPGLGAYQGPPTNTPPASATNVETLLVQGTPLVLFASVRCFVMVQFAINILHNGVEENRSVDFRLYVGGTLVRTLTYSELAPARAETGTQPLITIFALATPPDPSNVPISVTWEQALGTAGTITWGGQAEFSAWEVR